MNDIECDDEWKFINNFYDQMTWKQGWQWFLWLGHRVFVTVKSPTNQRTEKYLQRWWFTETDKYNCMIMTMIIDKDNNDYLNTALIIDSRSRQLIIDNW